MAMDEILALYQELHDSLGTNEICEDFCAGMIRVIQDAVDGIPSGARVGLRCADPCMSYLLEAVDFSRTNVVGVYDLMRDEGEFEGYPLFGADQLTDTACEYVIFATYRYRQAILQELKPYKGHVIDIYSLLSERGIELRGPVHCYQPGLPLVLNYFYLKHLEMRDGAQKEAALRELLQAAAEYKDFVLLSRIYEENGGANGAAPVLIETWSRAQRLLEVIRSKIQEREQKDIIAFWTDAVNYFDLADMPGMSERVEEGCSFERAYASSPWTRPVMQAMFRKLSAIDGFPDTRSAISRANSGLIQYLEDKGFEFRWVSFPAWAIDPGYTVPRIKEYMSSSVIWWYGLLDLLASKKPCFCIFHLLAEGHQPMFAPDLVQFDLLRPDLHAKSGQAMEQRRACLAYLDRCLTLYNRLFEGRDRIFFSDHGNYWSDIAAWSEERLHVYCLVLGENVPKRRIRKFFSHIRFQELIQWLLEPEKNDLEDALSDEAILQDVDYYAEPAVNAAIGFIREGRPKSGIAYRGIRTGDCKYVLNALGEEYYYIINKDGTETLTPLEDGALREELRSRCGTYFIDIRKYDNFKYSRKLYKSILRDHPEYGKPLWLTDGES